jgi:hypothetical protein
MSETPPETKPDPATVQKEFDLYNAELDRVYALWKDKTDYLKDFPEREGRVVALVLENQRLFEEASTNENWLSRNEVYEIIRDVFKDWVLFDLVSVQPLLGPGGSSYYKQFGSKQVDESKWEIVETLSSTPSRALTRKLKVLPLPKESFSVPGVSDAEALQIRHDMLVQGLRDEIAREVLTDLRNNAGTVTTKHISKDGINYEQVFSAICEMSGVIHRKTLRSGGNWLVTGSDFGAMIAKHNGIDFDAASPGLDLSPRVVGTMNARWKLIVDPLFPTNQILCGSHDPEAMYDGYVYHPYVFLSKTPVVLDPETFAVRQGVITRYGKRLVRGVHYGRISFSHDIAKVFEGVKKPTEV